MSQAIDEEGFKYGGRDLDADDHADDSAVYDQRALGVGDPGGIRLRQAI